jgi:glycosyltransferase involved in cell wall biosynthesis
VVTGTVIDVRPYLRGALALVVPMRVGGGTRLKILEAFAARAPVISTRVGAEGIQAEPERHYLVAEGHLCFTGSMDWQPNEDAACWFHAEILPEIRYVFPRLPFYVVGRNPSARLQALGEGDPATVVTGTVIDVRPYLRGALALVVPMRVGGGTRLKILEAFAAHAPVVSTRVGAEGIQAEPERHYLVAETAKEFAVQVRRLATDKALRQSLTDAAAQLVHERYGWNAIAREVAEFYEGAPPRTVHP